MSVTPTPSVSVIIPSYNSAEFVRDAAESALGQTLPPIEVIVVDDGSTDDTTGALEPLGDSIRLIRQDNAGVAAARNTGMRHARGTLIAFLDADDVWLPTKLERQVRLHMQDPRIGLTHSGLVDVDRAMNPLRERLAGLEGDHVAETMLYGQGDRLHVTGSTMMVTRVAVDAVGDFDVDVPPSEDWELMFRIARKFRVGFVPEPLVLYRQHPANAHRNIPRQERSMLLALDKVFANGDVDLRPLRPRAYATVRGWLAGCYWEIGDRRSFLRHAAIAAWLHPPVLGYFAAFPLRRLARLRNGGSQSIKQAGGPRAYGAQHPRSRAADVVRSETAKRCYFTGLTMVAVPRLLLNRRLAQRTVLVLSLHGVSDQENPFWPRIQLDHFETLARFLAQNCTVTTFGRLAEDADGAERPLVILSFDDGYLDFFDNAMPVLARYGLSANHNLIGECIETGEPPWIVKVCDELNAAPLRALRQIKLQNLPAGLPNHVAASKERFGAQLTNYLKSLPRYQGEAIWDEIRNALGDLEVPAPARMMGPAEVQAAIAAGHEIGVHSYSHESMALLDDVEFLADFCRSREIISELGGQPSIYAFPNGSYRPEQIAIAQRRGVEHVLLMGERPSTIGARVHTRLTVRGHHPDELILRALGHRPPLAG